MESTKYEKKVHTWLEQVRVINRGFMTRAVNESAKKAFLRLLYIHLTDETIPGWNWGVFDQSVVAGRRSINPPIRFLLAATRGISKTVFSQHLQKIPENHP